MSNEKDILEEIGRNMKDSSGIAAIFIGEKGTQQLVMGLSCRDDTVRLIGELTIMRNELINRLHAVEEMEDKDAGLLN